MIPNNEGGYYVANDFYRTITVEKVEMKKKEETEKTMDNTANWKKLASFYCFEADWYDFVYFLTKSDQSKF